jgi:hypothetical protein
MLKDECGMLEIFSFSIRPSAFSISLSRSGRLLTGG